MRPLELQPSSQIHGGHYDADEQTLTLHLNGGSYEFYGVPHSTALELEAASSHGDHFHANIRGKFEYQKLSD